MKSTWNQSTWSEVFALAKPESDMSICYKSVVREVWKYPISCGWEKLIPSNFWAIGDKGLRFYPVIAGNE